MVKVGDGDVGFELWVGGVFGLEGIFIDIVGGLSICEVLDGCFVWWIGVRLLFLLV